MTISAIEQSIRLGVEQDWSKPHMVAVKSEHKPSGVTLGDLLKSEGMLCR